MDLKKFIRSIPDYPKKGILFRDITTLIKEEKAFEETINQIVERSRKFKFSKHNKIKEENINSKDDVLLKKIINSRLEEIIELLFLSYKLQNS